MRHAPARHDAGWRRDPGTRQDRGPRRGLGPREGRSPGQRPGPRAGWATRGPREGRGTRYGGPGPRHGAGYRDNSGVWGGLRGHRAAGWRADPGRRTAGLRRFWPAAMTPAAIAACTLGAVALAGLIVIAVSMAVAAYGPGGLAAGGSLSQALEACSGELALLALTVAVVLGVAATERHFLPARTRVTAQLVHRAVALIAVGFLVVHILLETVFGPGRPARGRVPLHRRGRPALPRAGHDRLRPGDRDHRDQPGPDAVRPVGAPTAVADGAPVNLRGVAAGDPARHPDGRRPRVGGLDVRDLRGAGGRGHLRPCPHAGHDAEGTGR